MSLRELWLENPDDTSDFILGFVVGAFVCGMLITLVIAFLAVIG